MTLSQTVYTEALRNGMPDTLAKLILAQSLHETGGFTSNIFLDCNNAFGYKYVGQVQATGGSCTSHSYYAAYNTLEESVKELTDWIKRRQADGKFPADLSQINSPSQYGNLLKNAGYYEDPVSVYVNGLTYWLNQAASAVSSPIGLGTLVGLAIIAGYFYKRYSK